MAKVNLLLRQLVRTKWHVLGLLTVLAILFGLFIVFSQPRSRLIWTLPHYVSKSNFSQDGHLLITLDPFSQGSILTLWDSSTGAKNKERAFDVIIDSFAVNPHESTISAVTQTGLILTINALTLETESTMNIVDAQLHKTYNNIVYSLTGKYFCITGIENGYPSNGFAQIYDVQTGSYLTGLKWPQEWEQTPSVFSPDGTRLAIGTSPTQGKGILRIWDTSSWQEILSMESDNSITSLAWSPDGDFIAIGNLSGEVDSLHSASLTKTFHIKTKGSGISSLAYTTDSCFIIISGAFFPTQILDSKTGSELTNLSYGFSADSKLILSPKDDLALISEYYFQDRPSKSTSEIWDVSDYLKCSK